MERHVNEPRAQIWRLLRGLPAAAACLACLVMPAFSQNAAKETAITVGDGWGVVKELRHVDLQAGEHDVDFEAVPAEADLASLVLRSRRISFDVLSWDWVNGAAGGVVRCRIRSPVSASRVGVDFLYRVPGMKWSAIYEIVVRGEGEDEREPVSTDLRGVVRLVNGTAQEFSNAVIRLSGADREAPADGGPGFLFLDRASPLMDLWFDAPEPEAVNYAYDLPSRATLRPYSETDLPIITRSRTPARRVYSMAAEDFVLNSRELLPLRKWIVFRHEESRQQALMLPPGDVRVLLGGVRRQFVQTARFKRTAPGDEIRVDLGVADEVRGRRSAGARRSLPGGATSETFFLHLRNDGDSDVIVEVDEKPPAPLGWRVISSTHANRTSGVRLFFSPVVPAGVEEAIEYQISVSEPQI